MPPHSRPKTLRDGPVTTVAKFIWNAKPGKESNIISRTFGKVAIIDRAWAQSMQDHVEMPKNDEFWLVDVCKDMCAGTNKGVLVVMPRYPLERGEPMRLIPGGFEEQLVDGILYVYPKHPGPYWISSLSMKDLLKAQHNTPTGIIVVLPQPTDAMERATASLKKPAERQPK